MIYIAITGKSHGIEASKKALFGFIDQIVLFIATMIMVNSFWNT